MDDAILEIDISDLDKPEADLEVIEDGKVMLVLEVEPDFYQQLIEYISSGDGLDLHQFCSEGIGAWIEKDKFEQKTSKFHDRLAGVNRSES